MDSKTYLQEVCQLDPLSCQLVESGFHFHEPGSNWEACLESMVADEPLHYDGDTCTNCGALLEAEAIHRFRVLWGPDQSEFPVCLDCEENVPCRMPHLCLSCHEADPEQLRVNRIFQGTPTHPVPHFAAEVLWNHPDE